MKRINTILFLGLLLGLLLPSVIVATPNAMIMRGGGGGGPTPSPTLEVEYYTSSGQDKWAVIIGISDYDGRSNDLWNPHNDALEMRAILNAYGYNWAYAQDSAATRDNIMMLMDWLIAHEGPNSEVVFFYSGHGSRTNDGSWDTDVESDGYDECIVSWDARAITDSYMSGKVAEMESDHIAMVYCSCHGGGMFDQSYETRSGVLYIAAAEADHYLELENTLFFYYFGDQGLLNGPYDNLQDAFWYARPIVIAEQPDSCPIMLDLFGAPFYVK